MIRITGAATCKRTWTQKKHLSTTRTTGVVKIADGIAYLCFVTSVTHGSLYTADDVLQLIVVHECQYTITVHAVLTIPCYLKKNFHNYTNIKQIKPSDFAILCWK